MNIALVTAAKYWAGANRPWYVGQGMVTDYLQGKGFANVQWHKRAESLPADINPRASTTYSDDWDEWVSADYQGPLGSLSPRWICPGTSSTCRATRRQSQRRKRPRRQPFRRGSPRARMQAPARLQQVRRR